MTAKQKMIAIVGKAIVDTLEEYANKQPNLASETSRFKIMTDVMDKVVKVIDDPNFKK
jgi:23S rRNA G2445 N2-methylase RlmL